MGIKIRQVSEKTPVYDITVADNHNFFGNGILVSNCAEITLASGRDGTGKPETDRTAICCLSAFNLDYYDEWKNNHQFYLDTAEMLDNVLEYFIEKAPEVMWRAVESARGERSVGIGALGFHSYLQKKGVALESATASALNTTIFKTIKRHLDKANHELAVERGEAPDIESKIKLFDVDGNRKIIPSSKKVKLSDDTKTRAFMLKRGDVVMLKGEEFEIERVEKPRWATGKRLSHTTALMPNACQDLQNKVFVNGEIKTVEESLKDGGVDIEKIHASGEKQWVDLKTSITVDTFNGKKDVNKVWYNGEEPLYEIEFEDGAKYKFTENHRLMVRTKEGYNDWVRVGDLTGDENIVNRDEL